METNKTIISRFLLLPALLAISSISVNSQDWQLIEFPSYDHLTAVVMISADSGLVVTASGYCFRTSDRGKSWQKSEIIKNIRIESVYFEDSQNGWACGHLGSIFKTSDGGSSWDDVSFDDIRAIFFDIEMKDARTGVAVGIRPLESNRYNGIAVKTVDGGKNWEKFKAPGLAYSEIRQSQAKNKMYFMAMGRLNISDDDGKSWQSVATLEGTPARTFSMYGSTGIMAGPNGTCGYSNDSGKTWYSKEQDKKKSFLSSILLNSQYGYVAGSRGAMMVTFDGGINWTEEETPLELTILDMCFVDSYLFAVGSDGLIMYKEIRDKKPKD